MMPFSINAELALLAAFVKENLILTILMVFSYVLFYIYSFIHNTSTDSEIYEIDVVSSGVSSILTVCYLIGLDDSTKGFDLSSLDFSSNLIRISGLLLIYGLLLVIIGFGKDILLKLHG